MVFIREEPQTHILTHTNIDGTAKCLVRTREDYFLISFFGWLVGIGFFVVVAVQSIINLIKFFLTCGPVWHVFIFSI